MSPPTLQTTEGKDPYKYNTTQTTQYDMSPPTLHTTEGKDPYKYDTRRIVFFVLCCNCTDLYLMLFVV
jgi:hypothetical protein